MRRITATGTMLYAVVAINIFLLPNAHAGQAPAYTYGEQWWSEYRSDKGANLLLHFGPPQQTRVEKVKAAVDQKREEDALLSNTEIKDLDNAGGRRVQTMSVSEMELPPVDESLAMPGLALDYSNKRRKVTLGAGYEVKAESGRFGAGLLCDGSGAIQVGVNDVESVEAWLKVDAYPKADACIFALAQDASRLLLRPDGRLEYRLKNPHGEFDRAKISDAAIQAILKKNAEIVSPQPLPLNEWTHVIIRKQSHAMPGGGEPWEARLVVNGNVVAGYQSERYNLGGGFMGGHETQLVIGNSSAGNEGFKGVLDEVRVSSRERVFYERPEMPWKDAAATRALQFDRPWFRNDSTAFHVSFDKGAAFDRGPAGAKIQLELHGQKLEGLHVDGVRGKGLVIDPAIGFPSLSLSGMNAGAGVLEFWLRPVNWDDVTGYWHHSPPPVRELSVARVFAKGKGKDPALAFNVTIPRAYNLERQRVPVDPGHWMHLALVWDVGGWALYCNDRVISGGQREPGADLKAELLHVEFGVNNPITVKNAEAPRIEIDEAVGYTMHMPQDEVAQAHKRWMGALEPMPLYQASFQFKYALQKLEFSLRPLLAAGVIPATSTLTLVDAATGKAVLGPLSIAAPRANGLYEWTLSEGKPFAFGSYRFDFTIADAAGKELIKGSRDWKYEEEPWRNNRAGILEKVPLPWSALRFDGKSISTRMTQYTLGADGLPSEIVADGVNLLAAPMCFLEGGKALTGVPAKAGDARETDAVWSARFSGTSCDVQMDCRAEYDGMIRYELRVVPKGGEIQPLRMDIPIKPELATHFLTYSMGARGVNTGVLSLSAGSLTSTKPAGKDAYGFWGHCDVNDRNRGLWWFCDNAAGWGQSPRVPAIDIVRENGAVTLRLNLVAETGPYAETRPIVFAILPHPARPLPDKHRLLERVDPKQDALACSAFDAFMPWPTSPRSGGESLNMTLFPADDPAKPAAGPSWDYAASCIPIMKATKPTGYRTLYLSRAWFSCRAGAYDNWEWRSGESSAVSLTPYFNNYLCWEMNEWIGRGIFDAIYLDECYETPARNLEAGFSIKLPDGSEQPGVTNFAFRDLMRRWRGIFHQNGREPMFLAHHTYSFQYPGLLYCDAVLDGENFPIVSLSSRDWIDSVALSKYEVTQSGRMWGMTPFWMPFVAEGGFENKEKSVFPKWQWRMARQAQSVFAHFEIATAYEGQGAQVYKAYWKDLLAWGAGDPTIPFVPYWQAAPQLSVEGQGKDALVSFYRSKGRLLLIASNRLSKDVELRIKIDRAALGLKTPAAIKDIDSGAKPPAGEDFVKGSASAAKFQDPADLLGKDAIGKGVDDLLDDPASKAKESAKAFSPRWDGETLILPMRARDFRMLSIE